MAIDHALERTHLTKADLEARAEKELTVIAAFGTEDGVAIPERLGKVIRHRLLQSMIGVRDHTLAAHKETLRRELLDIDNALCL